MYLPARSTVTKLSRIGALRTTSPNRPVNPEPGTGPVLEVVWPGVGLPEPVPVPGSGAVELAESAVVLLGVEEELPVSFCAAGDLVEFEVAPESVDCERQSDGVRIKAMNPAKAQVVTLTLHLE